MKPFCLLKGTDEVKVRNDDSEDLGIGIVDPASGSLAVLQNLTEAQCGLWDMQRSHVVAEADLNVDAFAGPLDRSTHIKRIVAVGEQLVSGAQRRIGMSKSWGRPSRASIYTPPFFIYEFLHPRCNHYRDEFL